MFHVKHSRHQGPAAVKGSALLPVVVFDDFQQQITVRCPLPIEQPAVALLYGHYQALRKWSARVALIGPGTVEEVFDRHYGESLAALPWLTGGSAPPRILDVGSGAGFPGAVLALARPGLDVVLVESRRRKCTFLEAAVRLARAECLARGGGGQEATAKRALDALSVRVVNARIGHPLPAELPLPIDIVTSRAVRLSPGLLEPLIESQPDARFVLWLGADTELPASLVAVRSVRLAGSRGRFLVEATTKKRAEHA